MKKVIFLVTLALATPSTSLPGMNVTQEIAEIKSNIDLLTTLAQDGTAHITKDDARYAALIRDINLLTQNLVAQHEEIKILRDTIQQLNNRVTRLEQQRVISPEGSTASKIVAHPMAWFGLIAICMLISIVYERQQKKEERDEDTDDNNTESANSIQ
jgi:hypothetical protein